MDHNDAFTESCVDDGIELSVASTGTATLPAYSDCQKMCQLNPPCYQFTYRKSDGFCWIISLRNGKRISNTNYVTGLATCLGKQPLGKIFLKLQSGYGVTSRIL